MLFASKSLLSISSAIHGMASHCHFVWLGSDFSLNDDEEDSRWPEPYTIQPWSIFACETNELYYFPSLVESVHCRIWNLHTRATCVKWKSLAFSLSSGSGRFKPGPLYSCKDIYQIVAIICSWATEEKDTERPASECSWNDFPSLMFPHRILWI